MTHKKQPTRAVILLHSATGNTRLVIHFAAEHLESLGFECQVHDIVADPAPPNMSGVDLLGVAFPVMYGNPSLAMTRFLGGLGGPGGGRPAFVLATASGEPFAALPEARRLLDDQGFVPLAAHWTIAPTSYPPHVARSLRASARPLTGTLRRATAPLGRRFGARWPHLRALTSGPWPQTSTPEEVDRDALLRFLDHTAGRVLAAGIGARLWPDEPSGQGLPGMARVGRLFPVERIADRMALRWDPRRCARCGACTTACPSGCITEEPAGQRTFGAGCTACYACYNACAAGAISSSSAPGKIGRYSGPPREMLQLFPRTVCSIRK